MIVVHRPLQKNREFMKHMNNKILMPTSFSPTN